MNSIRAMAAMSAPAAKALALPVITMQPMVSSASKRCSTSPSSFINASFKAFSALGRFRVIQPTRRSPSPRVSTSKVS